MTDEAKIKSAYNIIRSVLPTRLIDKLKFLNPDRVTKPSGLNISRGRIKGINPNGIWDPKWCFYEIGVGIYPDAKGATGGIGFVKYRSRGNGRFIHQYLSRIEQSNAGFKFKPSLDETLTLFKYYKPSQSTSFPIAHAAKELAALITSSFDDINKLIV
jgi:hypothetical protein